MQRREEAEELRAEGPDPERLGRLRRETRERELELLTALAARSDDPPSPALGTPRDLAALRERLPQIAAEVETVAAHLSGAEVHLGAGATAEALRAAGALAHLRLPAALVTLSGCGTGLSTVEAGDEALGLIRALLQAGARALVASLWDADDDSAARFMAAFYDHWAQGRSRAEALQGAILALRAERPHPCFWAPFQLVGDPR